MQTAVKTVIPSKKSPWTGFLNNALTILFLLMNGIAKLFNPSFVVEVNVQMGSTEDTIVGIGINLSVCILDD